MICNECQSSYEAHPPIVEKGISKRDPKLDYWLCKPCNEKKNKKDQPKSK